MRIVLRAKSQDYSWGRVLGQEHTGQPNPIVFWSDHGLHLGELGLWCKTSNFELDARVPLIIADPRRQNSSERVPVETKAIVELLDLYPTLVELCGLRAPGGLEGVSLAPVLADPTRAGKPYALTQHPRPAYYKGSPQVMGYSIRTDRYRFTQWRSFKDGQVVAEELYDHANDPHETRNVMSLDENKTTVARHRTLLSAATASQNAVPK